MPLSDEMLLAVATNHSPLSLDVACSYVKHWLSSEDGDRARVDEPDRVKTLTDWLEMYSKPDAR